MIQRTQIKTPGNILLLTVLLALISVILIMFVGSLLAIPLYGIHPSQIFSPIQDLNAPSSVQVMKYFQMLQTIGLFVVPPFLVAKVAGFKPAHFLNLNHIPGSITVISAILLVLVMGPVIFVVGEWNAGLHFPDWLSGLEEWLNKTDEEASETVRKLLDTQGTLAFLFNILIIAILPSLGEELLFRGIFQKQLIRLSKSQHLGILISAFIFSALHMQFSGFFPRFILGAVFGYLFLWSGSLWVPILAHFFNNTFALIAHSYFSQTPLDPLASGEEVMRFPTSVTAISLVVSVVLIWIIYYSGKKSRKSNIPDIM